MREGDVVLASRGNRTIQGIGVVDGPYRYDAERTVDHYRHSRSVRWVWKTDGAGTIDVSEIYDRSFSMVSIYGLYTDYVRWENLLPYLNREAADARPLPHVLVIDEINRANVSKVLGELITLLKRTSARVRLTPSRSFCPVPARPSPCRRTFTSSAR